MNEITPEDPEARPGFVIARTPKNGNLSRSYLRGFEIVGRDGLAHLAYGALAAAHVFDSRREAEEVARRLRRRATIGAYDYLVEEHVTQPTEHPL